MKGKWIDRVINWLSNARNKLEENKVFFETVIAVIISGLSLFIAIRANSIYEDQKEIEIKAASPFIDVASEYDEDGNVIKVEVINDGGLLDEMHIEIYPYILYKLINEDMMPTYGVYPANIEYEADKLKYEGASGFEPEDNRVGFYGNSMYTILAPHTKTGTLYEIRNTDLMDYLFEDMENVLNEQILYVEEGDNTRILSDRKEASSSALHYAFYRLSFEYLIKIDYSSVVDNTPKTEIFRVLTGIGFGPGRVPGVSLIKDTSWVMEIYNILNEHEQEMPLFIGGRHNVREDNTKIFSYLLDRFLNGKYELNINYTLIEQDE